MMTRSNFARSSRFLAIALLVCLWAVPADAQQQRQPVDATNRQIQTLAVVNGQSISRQQVASACLSRFGEDVLETIINKHLVLNECKRRGIIITEKDVNDEILARANKFGMSTEKFIKLYTTRQQVTVDHLKNNLIWTELALRRLAAANMQVSKEEIQKRMQFEFGARVQVREIAVNSRQLAEQLLAQVRQNPKEFGRLAKDNSVDLNSASVRGLLPPIRQNSGFPKFESIAFSLQPGQISDIFQVQDKFIILMCERIIPATEVPSDQLAVVHQRIIDELSKDKLADSATSLFKQMQETVKIVNVMNDSQLSIQMPGVAATVDNAQITKRYLAEECITRFGRDMLEAEIMRTLLVQALKQNNMEVTSDDTMAEVKRAAEFAGVFKKDGSVDIDKYLQYVVRGDMSKIEFYIADEVWASAALKKLVEAEVVVTEEDLRKGFEANFGPRVEVRAILTNDERRAREIWKMATTNPDETYFGQLAAEYSIEPASKANFGQVPPIQRHGGRPALEQEAFMLKQGEISQVVQVGEHWVILYCQGLTQPKVTEFSAVKDELYRNIYEKKLLLAMENKRVALRTEAQVDNFLAGTSQPGKQALQTIRQADRNNGNRR